MGIYCCSVQFEFIPLLFHVQTPCHPVHAHVRIGHMSPCARTRTYWTHVPLCTHTYVLDTCPPVHAHVRIGHMSPCARTRTYWTHVPLCTHTYVLDTCHPVHAHVRIEHMSPCARTRYVLKTCALIQVRTH